MKRNFFDNLGAALGLGDDRAEQSTREVFADFLRGSVSASGIVVTPKKALQISGVWSSVCILSEAVGSLPLIVYKRLPDGGKERATDHPMYRVLRSRPNRRHTAAVWRSLMQADVETSGTAFAKKVRIAGQVKELIPIPAGSLEDVKELNDGSCDFTFRRRGGGTVKTFNDTDLLILTGPGGDGILGANIVEEFKETIGLAYALEMYLAYTLRNAGRVGGIVSPKTPMVESELNKLKTWLDKDHTGIENAGKWLWVPTPLEFGKGSMNFEEAQVVELDDKILARLARIFRIPLHMLASNIAQPRANMEQQGREFVDQSLRARLKRWEERLNAEFFDDGQEYFCEFLLDDLLRGDAATRALVYRALVELGIMTRNEARERENLNKLDGLDEPLTPMNMGQGQVQPAGAGALILLDQMSRDPKCAPALREFYRERGLLAPAA